MDVQWYFAGVPISGSEWYYCTTNPPIHVFIESIAVYCKAVAGYLKSIETIQLRYITSASS